MIQHKFDLFQPQFRQTHNEKEVNLFHLKNALGMAVFITNYGARVVSLFVPDRAGNMADVVLGFDSLEGYLTAEEKYHGATVGRYANRIAQGRFALDGIDYQLAINNPPNSLHGGPDGFHTAIWDAHQPDNQTLELSYLSPDGEEGFPGNLQVKVVYQLSPDNALSITYTATTDKKTVLNLTHHSYFNLNGEGQGTINDHVLNIMSDWYTPVNSHLIPTGEMALVEGTPFDFRTPTAIGSRLGIDNQQLKYGNGYDHNYVLKDRLSGTVNLAARVVAPRSGRTMEVFTDAPGMQFYGGNWLSGNDQGKSGRYTAQSAFCLETQHFPDSPNQPHFPSPVLIPGETYRTETIYRFGSSPYASGRG